MAYTRHGHHIYGSVLEKEKPLSVARCGGPGLCLICSKDEALYFGEVDNEEQPELPTTPGSVIKVYVLQKLDGVQSFDPPRVAMCVKAGLWCVSDMYYECGDEAIIKWTNAKVT